MGQITEISWCDHTFNPWVGCTKVSAACDHCYAESWAKRSGHPELWTGRRRRTSESNWRQPLKWAKVALQSGQRKRVFCASLADVFDNQVPIEWRRDLFNLIWETRASLDWLLLTKRPQNIAKMLPYAIGECELWPWRNVWLGTTVENQEEADRRIPSLLGVPASIRFLSCEPLLGPITVPRVDWIIAGGESGAYARPINLDWVRALRDHCKQTGTAFHFKQWGGLRPKSGGCLLDGVEHKEFPRAA